jgi:hypothetical protein
MSRNRNALNRATRHIDRFGIDMRTHDPMGAGVQTPVTFAPGSGQKLSMISAIANPQDGPLFAKATGGYGTARQASRTRQRSPMLRLTGDCSFRHGGRARRPVPHLSALPRGRAYGEEAKSALPRRRNAGGDPERGEAERALGAGLRARLVRLRPAVPHPQHR